MAMDVETASAGQPMRSGRRWVRGQIVFAPGRSFREDHPGLSDGALGSLLELEPIVRRASDVLDSVESDFGIVRDRHFRNDMADDVEECAIVVESVPVGSGPAVLWLGWMDGYRLGSDGDFDGLESWYRDRCRREFGSEADVALRQVEGLVRGFLADWNSLEGRLNLDRDEERIASILSALLEELGSLAEPPASLIRASLDWFVHKLDKAAESAATVGGAAAAIEIARAIGRLVP